MNTAKWVTILDGCKVSMIYAYSWASSFADAVTDTTFSCDEELATFLGQVLWESNSLKELEENLNYSSDSLLKLFPNRITVDQATEFGRTSDHPANQQAIANIIYGGNFGLHQLGNTEPEDGWNFRGSGLIQMTGRDNFQQIEDVTGLPIIDHPELIRQPGYQAMDVAICWWHLHVKDNWTDPVKLRKIVNGGDLGLQETIDLTGLALRSIKCLQDT